MTTQDVEFLEPQFGDRPTVTPLDFLRAVYTNEGLPLSVRMRAAIEAAPYMHPKLSATAIVQGGNFAELLEARCKRIAEAKRKEIEAVPNSAQTDMPSLDQNFAAVSRRE